MRIAIEAGGFSPGEADQLRRAMATFKRTGTIGNYRQQDDRGHGRARTIRSEFAERCFKQIEGFGEYGFPESHAASFALLVYASCWFKAFYPDVFCAAILNSQPMGFYAPAQLVRDARDHGVEISDGRRQSFRLGLHAGDKRPSIPRRIAATACRDARRHQDPPCGPARLPPDQGPVGGAHGSSSSRGAATAMIRCATSGCAPASTSTRSSGSPRPTPSARWASTAATRLWAVRALDGKSAAERLPLFDRPEHPPARQRAGNEAAAHAARRACHPRLPLARPFAQGASRLPSCAQRLDRVGVTPNARLTAVPDGRRVSVAGLVLVRQRPGKGNAIFLTLEDEKAVANIIVWPTDIRAVPARSSWARNSSASAASLQSRIGRHPYRGRDDRGPDALARRSLLEEAAGEPAGLPARRRNRRRLTTIWRKHAPDAGR